MPGMNTELDIEGEYKTLDQRYNRKKHIYQHAGQHYKKKVVFYFIIPLLILQLGNAIIPSFFQTENPDGTFDEETKKNGKMLRVLTTCISALTAAWLGLQARLKWGMKAEQFNRAAATYHLLQSNAFYKRKEAYARIGNNVSDEELANEMPEYLSFMEYSAKLENYAVEGCPIPPDYIVASVTLKQKAKIAQENLDAKERKNSGRQVLQNHRPLATVLPHVRVSQKKTLKSYK